jgi:NAD(P)-dependent dehydrogenase (short-subunit alcohol dehydrogenase family)
MNAKSGRPVAIVTGARRGIGAAVAVSLAGCGFDVAITDVAEEGADATLSAVASAGGQARFIRSDIADVGDHARVMDELFAWGGAIDCLVNNAGISAPRRGDLLELVPEAFDQVLDVNLRGAFFFTQAVAKRMLVTPALGPRSIITISSVNAELASPERGEYSISKAGLAMLTKLFALRLAGDGIAVFEVRPGVIRTSMTQVVAEKYERRIAEGLVPMGRWGTPQDVGETVAGLAGGRFAFSTGSVVHVDGGLAVPRL